MKPLFSILVIVGFLSVAVFGFSAMGHHSGHSSAQICIATIAKGFECPTGVNLADFHISAFRVFSSAVLSSYFLIIIFAAFLMAGSLTTLPHPQPVSLLKLRRQNSFRPIFDQDFKNWFSLHENSPSLA